MERNTPQKQIIYDYIKKTKTHPTAEEVHKAVKATLPGISLGTVYRILNNLVEKSEVRELCVEKTRYDGDISGHAHFVCRRCGRVFDIFDLNLKIDPEDINTNKNIDKINNYQIYFYGICRKCKSKNK